MTKSTYIIDNKNPKIDSIATNLIKELNSWVQEAKNKQSSFQVTLEPYKEKRSGKQLAAYWVLIKVVKDWMNNPEHGDSNNYSDKQVSDWVKIKAGHCLMVGGSSNGHYPLNNISMAKSISDKSDCTRDDMARIINWIVIFGAEMDIPNCEIKDDELDKLLKYYE